MKPVISVALTVVIIISGTSRGVIIEVDTVLEGSTANFTCTVKACPSCTVLWRIFDFETGLIQFKPSSERRDIGNNKFKSTLRIEAVNISVIQCESYMQHSEDKRYYSKFVVVDVHQRPMSTSIATQGPVITSTPAPVSSSPVVTTSSPPVSSSPVVTTSSPPVSSSPVVTTSSPPVSSSPVVTTSSPPVSSSPVVTTSSPPVSSSPVVTTSSPPVSSSQVVTTSSPPVSSSQVVNPTPVESVENSDFKMNSAGIYAVLLSSFVTLYL